MIRFSCPKCQTVLQAAAEQAGAAVACARCQTQVRVPPLAATGSNVARPPAVPAPQAAQVAPWYYSRAGQRHGPFTTAQLRQFAQTGQLQHTDSVWKDGMPGWRPASEVKGLFPAARPAQEAMSSASTSPPPNPVIASDPFGALGGNDGPAQDRPAARSGKRSQGVAPRTKLLVIGAAVAVPALLIGLVAVLLMGKSSSTPQGGGEKTENKAGGPQGGLKAEKVSVPDFSKVDYSVDFSKVDYTKGPMGQTVEQKKFNNAEGEPITATGYTQGGKFLMHGKVTGSFRTGKARSEVWWFAGQGHGTFKEWYENGQLREQGSNKDGLKQGKCTQWHENGQRKTEEWFLAGELHGVATEWYKNGQKKAEFTYVNDKLHGETKKWYESGKKWAEISYKNQVRHGAYREWDQNGRRVVEVAILDGVPQFSTPTLTKEQFRIMLELTADKNDGTVFIYNPNPKHENAFVGHFGKPDAGYSKPAFGKDNVQDWTYKCTDGRLRLKARLIVGTQTWVHIIDIKEL